MQPRRERFYRFTLALGLLYGLLAARYLLLEGDPAKMPFVQSLALGWVFAVVAVLAGVLPARPPAPHENRAA